MEVQPRPRILALDISTHMGWAVWKPMQFGGCVNDYGVVFHPGEKGMKANDCKRWFRYQKYAQSLREIMSTHGVTQVYVEGYGYGNPYTLGPLIELGTILREVVFERVIGWTEVPPTSLKKFLTGSGNAKKELMMLTVFKKFAISCSDNNEADAIALAYYGACEQGLLPGYALKKGTMAVSST